MLKKGLTTLIMGAVLALSPASALAAEHGGHGGGRAGGGFARGGGGYSHQAPARGFSGGREFHGNDGRYYGGGYYRGGRYFYGGPAFSFGFYGAPYYGPYAYGPAPCGYYDQYGNWIPTACALGPYGY